MITTIPARLVRRAAFEWSQRRLVRDVERVTGGQPMPEGQGPTIGFATFGCGCWHLGIEALLSHALALRGARPEFLICDLPELPLCAERTAHSRRLDRCDGCVDDKAPLLSAAGLRWRGLSTVVTPGAVSRAIDAVHGLDSGAIAAFTERGWPVGAWLHSGASHFLRCDARGDAPEKLDARRRLLATAIVAVEAVERWLDAIRPDMVMVLGGSHVMWRVTLELARGRGIPVTCREMGKGGWDRHIYALNADSMSPDLDREWSRHRDLPLTPHEDAAVDALIDALPSLTYGPGGRAPSAAAGSLRDRLGIPAGRRVAVAFTNVTWDMATAGRDAGFDGMLDWLRYTIAVLGGRDDVNLVIRVHPAEDDGQTRERVADLLSGSASSNVRLVGPGEVIAARELCALAELVLAYNTTTAIEAAAAGATVILAGDCHFRGRGFTIDVDRPGYDAILGRWLAGERLAAPASAVAFARRYCHLFFLRYQIAMGWTTSPLRPPYRLLVRSLEELRPGVNPVLDLVCDGILAHRQILLPRAGVETTCPQ